MRVHFVLWVATAVCLASSGAASIAIHAPSANTISKARTSYQRNLRSYSMNVLESEGEERKVVNAKVLDDVVVRVQAPQPDYINVDDILRAFPSREQVTQRAARYFESHNGVLDGWLYKTVLDELLVAGIQGKRNVFTQWVQDGVTVRKLTSALNANPYTTEEYKNVVRIFELFVRSQRSVA
ncbi:unnamed protein product [Phytophthora fragariaefolia]|uniref:RxLR effector protein n=1 Tax=Phytophthora fragariaefolia TaxID=1490495 RepID=A0A9W6Y9U7_9STRA|nr:unnamed protein product [Phytophthora fragariaefolia]